MGNPYFNTKYNPYNPEHKLYNDATNEIVQMYGVDMYFMPKEIKKDDHIFGEDVLARFSKIYEICFFIHNYTGWEGAGDLFSKFGFQTDDTLTLVSQQDAFRSATDPSGNPDEGIEPKNGDIIYHEASSKLFEITHVEKDDSFFQMAGVNMTFKLTCKLFTPSLEIFETGSPVIDQFTNKNDPNTSDEKEQFEDEMVNNIDFSEKDIFGNI